MKHQLALTGKKGEPFRGRTVLFLGDLIRLNDEPGIAGIEFHRLRITSHGAFAVAGMVPNGNAEVAVNLRNGRGVVNGGFPHGDCLGMTPAIEEQVAQTVGCQRVRARLGERPFENEHFIEAGGKEVVRIASPGGRKIGRIF